ncbi:RsmD family RNA methyltransferase [Candidatus Dependentiae bacterium]|nr:RsmD family RNA methyltransferase [Candidatus Dependentiae bacterium]
MITVSSGKFKNFKLKVPESIRPTKSIVKSAVFNILRHRNFGQGNNFIDLFAGCGNMGIEAASMGFTPFFSEKFKSVYEYLLSNLTKLKIDFDEYKFSSLKRIENKNKIEKTTVVYGDTVKIIDSLNFEFDVVYIDPPYDTNFGEKILNSDSFKKNVSSNTVILYETSKNIVNHDEFYIIENSKKYGDTILNIIRKYKI